jgi:hypothetical protein
MEETQGFPIEGKAAFGRGRQITKSTQFPDILMTIFRHGRSKLPTKHLSNGLLCGRPKGHFLEAFSGELPLCALFSQSSFTEDAMRLSGFSDWVSIWNGGNVLNYLTLEFMKKTLRCNANCTLTLA